MQAKGRDILYRPNEDCQNNVKHDESNCNVIENNYCSPRLLSHKNETEYKKENRDTPDA
jgi:hypothetical protein